MKVVLLSAGSSIHTVRWANSLSQAGIKIHVVTQRPVKEPLRPEVELDQFPLRGSLGYLTMVPGVKKLLRKIKPDLVNAHYASGYGTTGRLVGFHPWILSVWGCDVYEFPFRSRIHKHLVVSNLLAADALTSTSHCMATKTMSLSPKIPQPSVVPFGVNLESFASLKLVAKPVQDRLIVGTVKSMFPVYGIDVLVRSFAEVYTKLVRQDVRWKERLGLRLVGGGDFADHYCQLSKELGIAEVTEFVGQVPHSKVPEELSKIDIFVALSRSESFGVAAIEAGAAGLPVVVSDAEGLQEVVRENQTGLIVPIEDVAASATAIERLILDPALREKLGRQGREFVFSNYSWSSNVQQMIKVYEQTITRFRHPQWNPLKSSFANQISIP